MFIVGNAGFINYAAVDHFKIGPKEVTVEENSPVTKLGHSCNTAGEHRPCDQEVSGLNRTKFPPFFFLS